MIMPSSTSRKSGGSAIAQGCTVYGWNVTQVIKIAFIPCVLMMHTTCHPTFIQGGTMPCSDA